jgi:hypothetical protein
LNSKNSQTQLDSLYGYFFSSGTFVGREDLEGATFILGPAPLLDVINSSQVPFSIGLGGGLSNSGYGGNLAVVINQIKYDNGLWGEKPKLDESEFFGKNYPIFQMHFGNRNSNSSTFINLSQTSPVSVAVQTLTFFCPMCVETE